jgi:hypothetical protein
MADIPNSELERMGLIRSPFESPQLILPPDEPVVIPDTPLQPGNKPIVENFTVRIVDKSVFNRFAVGAFSLLFIDTIIWSIVWLVTYQFISEEWQWTTSFLAASVFFIWYLSAYWIQTDAQQMRAFTDNSEPRTVIVFPSGYALLPFWLSPYLAQPVIELAAMQDFGKKIKIKTKDQLDIIVDPQVQGQLVELFIEKYLAFTSAAAVHERIMAVISDRLLKLGGLNEWQTLSDNRARVFEWLNKLFGSPDQLTPAEQELSFNVMAIKVQQFDPEPGSVSEQIVLAAAAARELIKIYKMLRFARPGAEEKELWQTARRLLDPKLSETLARMEASPNLTTAVMGSDTEVAVRGGRGGGS